jgi:tRNA-specific 2-thiouridylase
MQPSPSGEEIVKCAEREFNDVKDVCKFLGLVGPLRMSFEKEYWNQVFVPMLEMYEHGLTPNPDVECNRHIKFGVVIKRLKDEFQKSTGRLAGRESPGWWLATGKFYLAGLRQRFFCRFPLFSGREYSIIC